MNMMINNIVSQYYITLENPGTICMYINVVHSLAPPLTVWTQVMSKQSRFIYIVYNCAFLPNFNIAVQCYSLHLTFSRFQI